MSRSHIDPPRSARLSREYRAESAVVFWKTSEHFGGLSNMARGFPVRIGTTEIASGEALYQALRFPASPTVQRDILGASNAWLAKRVARMNSQLVRPDWHRIRVAVMRLCLRLKLGHAPARFGTLLEQTGQLSIVERSARDAFWGAIAQPDGRLIGANVLGRLLMELRESLRRDGVEAFASVSIPDGIELTFLGERLSLIACTPMDQVADEQAALPFARSSTPMPTAR